MLGILVHKKIVVETCCVMIDLGLGAPYTPADSFMLGRTQETRGSELQAGARAELTPTPVTLALASLRGRAVAQTMIWLSPEKASTNYTAARVPILTELMVRAVPNVPAPILVDPSTGFSPLSLSVAERVPHATVIEIDRAEVIRSRQHRLRRGGISLPPNLETVVADLGVTPLPDALGGRTADVIKFHGAYLTPAESRRTIGYLHSILSAEGAIAARFPLKSGVERTSTATRFFKQQVGDLPGMVDDVNVLRHYFLDTGFREVEVIFPSQIVPQIGLATPVWDVEVAVIARK